MSKNIAPGIKVARPKAARFMQSPNKGTLGIEIAFEFMEPSTGITEQMNWVGWLTPNTIERTMDTLTSVLGFNGNDASDPATGMLTDPNALAWAVDVHLVVELEEYNQKYYPKIKWVNPAQGEKHQGTPEAIKTALDSVGFKAMFLASKQKKEVEQKLNSEVPF